MPMADKKRASSSPPRVGKAMDHQPSKRKRTDTCPVKKPAALPDAEVQLLRALEEEILKEEEKIKLDKNKKFPPEEEDDDYDESDDE
ncbi:hypothetical protein L917_07910 [Phytophthora nicotianae]|uniref:Uncharacterized protein n=1 Tax=Phytophthora nicotianae TaxID=4792 RepID=W2LBM4_PHYNI|nr:hypothetical protein L917_07910 [Phytophthora nicotianae]